MTRYSTQVRNAIREAHAAGMRPSVVKNKVPAGTLDGIGKPYPDLPDSSFWHIWRQAKREQQVEGRCPTCGQPRPGTRAPNGTVPEDGGILDRIAADLKARG